MEAQTQPAFTKAQVKPMHPRDLFDRLFAAYGPQHWWPAKTRFEVCVGAILTQNTAWSNVEKAIANLRREKLLTLKALAAADKRELARCIQPAGYFNQKAGYLKNFCRHVVGEHGTLAAFFRPPLPVLRRELLAVKGIGPETADSILLYAAGKPSFVIDAYTQRIVHRLGLSEEESYAGLKQFFESRLPVDERRFNEFHALFVEHAKRVCLKAAPWCGECCLAKECRKIGV